MEEVVCCDFPVREFVYAAQYSSRGMPITRVISVDRCYPLDADTMRHVLVSQVMHLHIISEFHNRILPNRKY